MSGPEPLDLGPAPVRTDVTDSQVEILRFAAHEARSGGAALATLVDIRGGAARALGSHVAVAADGRFCGYVSGGCVEAAVAAEALMAIAEGRDRMVMFGDQSPFFDIVLPCGGGITVAIHVMREAGAVDAVLEELEHRRAASLVYSPHEARILIAGDATESGWQGDGFVTAYRPRTRLLIAGQAAEVQAVQRLAEASGYEVILTDQLDRTRLPEMIDPNTAVILLHHDLDAEAVVLDAALKSRAFYIGALGSKRTHQRRIDRLRDTDLDPVLFDRIKAPIGIFGPTRDTASLALSVLGDVAASRLAARP